MEREEFLKLADECLAKAARWCEPFDPDELDFATTDGVVTIEFADRTRYVLNRQAATNQMWFAAGARAWHYNWNAARAVWLDDRDQHELFARVAEVVAKKLGRPVQAALDDGEAERALEASSRLHKIDSLRALLGGRGEATPLTEVEVNAILSRMSESDARPQVTIGVHKGDMVKIKSGAFAGLDGSVDEVSPEKGTVKVIVTTFGRPTPVELEYWEVEAL